MLFLKGISKSLTFALIGLLSASVALARPLSMEDAVDLVKNHGVLIFINQDLVEDMVNRCSVDYDSIGNKKVFSFSPEFREFWLHKHKLYLDDQEDTDRVVDLARFRSKFGLSPAECFMLQAYTSRSNAYKVINGGLRAGILTAELADLVELLDGGISKIPENNFESNVLIPFEVKLTLLRELEIFSGDRLVLRKTTLPASVLSTYQVGRVVSDMAFTSSTMAEFKRGGSLHSLYIISKTGRYIAPISRLPKEKEVIFKRDTRFEVLSRMKKDNGEFIFVLKELAP